MSVIISGDNGISDVDGSAGTPAIRGTDANTGIFFGADQVGVATNGVERVEFGNSETVFNDGGANVDFRVEGDTEANLLFVDASTDRVGIGTSSPTAPLTIVNSAVGEVLRLTSVAANVYGFASDGTISAFTGGVLAGTGGFVGTESNHPYLFRTNNTERARITNGGVFCSGRTTAIDDASSAGSGNFQSTSTALEVYRTSSSTNTVTQFFSDEGTTKSLRFGFRCNGGLANYQANNANLSDRREKTDFAPAKNYLDTICAIPVQTFNYINQSEDDPGLTLGVVAQDVQEVAPELVSESNWGTQEEPKMRLSIYQTDLQYALMKSIQELKAINDAQASRIETLEAKVAALEAK